MTTRPRAVPSNPARPISYIEAWQPARVAFTQDLSRRKITCSLSAAFCRYSRLTHNSSEPGGDLKAAFLSHRSFYSKFIRTGRRHARHGVIRVAICKPAEASKSRAEHVHATSFTSFRTFHRVRSIEKLPQHEGQSAPAIHVNCWAFSLISGRILDPQ